MEIITGHYTIKQIFKDHWLEYLERHPKTPDYIRNETRKVLSCRDSEKGGYLKYICPNHPNQYTIVPFSCKSRLCNVCGAWQTDKWIEKAIKQFPDTCFWHITFTIPDYLWYFFNKFSNRFLLDLLFKASSETVLEWLRQRENILPAIISVLHTFGKQINYNTHIHMIVTTGGLNLYQNEQLSWKKVNFLPEVMLKKRWKTILLTKLSEHLDSSFKKMLFKLNWYVHLGIRMDNPGLTLKYIGRYTKRAVMAESRIVKYDGNLITFFFEDKSEGWKKKQFCTLTWEEFISRLIQHIPQKQFRMIRYYGLLANPVKAKYQDIVFNLLNQKRIDSF